MPLAPTPPGGFAQHMADGGMPSEPWFIKREAAEMYHPQGLFNSSVAGRTDRLPVSVPAGAYVIPADVVSGLGEDNTMAGTRVLDQMMHTGPYGTPLPHGGGRSSIPKPPAPAHYAKGGATGAVKIIAAGGEYVIGPDAVRRLGGGDLKKGHEVLDAFVKRVRAHHVKTLKSLPGPKR